MDTNHRWLLEQLPEWEREGLISREAACTLRDRHQALQAASDSHPGAAQIVLGWLGALLVGLGLIAVIGYNWDHFSRSVRLLFAFIPLLCTQAASFRVIRGSAAVWVCESAALLQALATGACIAIVSQIYNLGGEWTGFLFWWMLLSLPLVWLMRSNAVAVFYLLAIATWSCGRTEAGLAFHDSPMMYPVLLLGVVPWWPGWPLKPRLSVPLRWVMTVSAFCGFFSAAAFVCRDAGRFSATDFGSAFWLTTLTGAVLVLFPLNESGIGESISRKPQVVLGTLWLFGYGLAATFDSLGKGIAKCVERSVSLPWSWGLLAVLAVFVFLGVKKRRWAVLAVASIGLLPLVAFPFGQLVPWIFTLHIGAIGLTLVLLDFCGRRGAPRFGALLLSVLIILRMADSHFSLLAKGVGFIVVGVAFLAFNLLMSRRRHVVRSV